MQEQEDKVKNNELIRYIEFSLGEEQYGIPLLQVREVISVPETTPIPNSPKYFEGIMNLRGQVISIVDLRTKLNIKPKENNSEVAVIIVTINDYNLGIIVDSINRVLNFTLDEVSDVPEVETQVKAKYIQGVYKKADSLTVLIDMAKVLDLKEIKNISK